MIEKNIHPELGGLRAPAQEFNSDKKPFVNMSKSLGELPDAVIGVSHDVDGDLTVRMRNETVVIGAGRVSVHDAAHSRLAA